MFPGSVRSSRGNGAGEAVSESSSVPLWSVNVPFSTESPQESEESGDALNVPPDETVYVGDSEIDIETARNAGLDCVCVAWGFRSEAFLAARGAERIVSSCLELADVLLL